MRKKTWKAICFLVLISGLLAACSKAESPKEDTSAATISPTEESESTENLAFSEEDAKNKTSEVVELMAAGQFEQVLEFSDATVQAAITADQLKDGWESIQELVGAYQSVAETITGTQQGMVYAQTYADHESGQSITTCTFNTDGSIAGININIGQTPAAEPLANPLPEGAQEREIKILAGTNLELTGKIVLPAGFSEDSPAVVLVQGSGPSDLDETIGANKPFRDIAHGLAAKGIVSIRFDKITYAHPEIGNKADLTIDDEYTAAVLDAVQVLKEETGVKKVYLVGHSQGGMLTPYLMQQSEGGFDGGIILAGTPRKLWELMYDQSMDSVKSATAEAQAQTKAELDANVEKLRSLEGMSDAEIQAETVFGTSAWYMHHFDQIDMLAIAVDNNLPLLVLQGEKDFQVYPEPDFRLLVEGLAPLGDLVTKKSYPGLNHLFMEDNGATIENYTQAYATPALISQEVIDDMADWLDRVSQ